MAIYLCKERAHLGAGGGAGIK